MEKQCSKCKKFKSSEYFHRRKDSTDGLRAECKVCWYLKCRTYIKTEMGQKSEKRGWQKYRKTDAGKAAQKRAFQKWVNTELGRATRRMMYKRHPERCQARNAVYAKIRRGEILRPEICYSCNTSGVAIEAHHYLGYAHENKFNVQWLCRKCHLKV